MKLMKSAVAVFIVSLIFGMLATCLTGYRVIGKAVYSSLKKETSVVNRVDSVFRSVDKAVSDAFIAHGSWIDLYGGIQKCLHKEIVPDAEESYTVLAGSDGKLYFTGSVFSETERDYNKSCLSLEDLYRYCNENDVKLLYVTAPHKYNSKEVKLPVSGVHDYYNDAIEFHNALKSSGVPELNLMEEWEHDSESYSDGFFVTDHHWNIRTAFWGFQKIVNRIADPSEKRGVQEQRFTEYIVEDTFLGSMGTRVGRFYAGIDDISVISPSFETDFEVTFDSKTLGTQEMREGSWDEAILTQPATYTMYITSDNALIHVENKHIRDGRNVLFIKDSFGVPVAAWLGCMYENMWEMDLRYQQNESVFDFIKQKNINDVIILYNPEAIGNLAFYTFDKNSFGE